MKQPEVIGHWAAAHERGAESESAPPSHPTQGLRLATIELQFRQAIVGNLVRQGIPAPSIFLAAGVGRLIHGTDGRAMWQEQGRSRSRKD